MKYNATSVIDHVESQLCENVTKLFELLRPVTNLME